MEREIEVLLQLLNSTINKTKYIVNDASDISWEKVYRMARISKLVPLLYPAVANIGKENHIDQELLVKWNKHAIGYILREYEKYQSLRKLLWEGEQEGIQLIIFKGCVLASLYPQFTTRISNDTDIFVYDYDKEKAICLLERLGYVKDEESSKNNVFVYRLPQTNHKLELHFCLWEDHKGEKMDILASMDLTEKSSLIQIEINGIQVTTLGYTEHLIYQMFHIIKHFSLQGIGIRYMSDITLFINHYIEFIDVNKFWDRMSQMGYIKFCQCFFRICIEYLDMRKDIMMHYDSDMNKSVEILLLDLISVGVIYEKKDAKWQILGIMAPYFVGKGKIPKTKLGRNLKILFPSRNALPDCYRYAKKYGVLLPFAWVHKWINYLIKWSKHKNDWFDVKEKLTVAEQRLVLLKDLGLMDDYPK